MFLSLLLAAALTVGGMTTAFATESPADTAATQDAAAADADGTSVNTDKLGADVEDSFEEETDATGNILDAEDAPEIGTDDGSAADVDAGDDADAEDSADAGYDADYGLYGGYDGQDSMDDEETAGACVGWDLETMSAIKSDSGLWWIDDYYVGESNQYNVEKNDDFSLKYQIEFHASEDLIVGAVQIVVDASLGTYRDRTNIIPTELGIPYGTSDKYTTSSSSPFNYYYINSAGDVLTVEEAKTATGVQLVIWNYREIASGSNAMFQVLYKALDVMQIPDMTEWSLELTATVDEDNDGNITDKETVYGNTLSGVVDTTATISSVTKTAYMATDKSYTPELYTESQVGYYIHGAIPEAYAGDNFDKYIYIVWRVTLKGTATQPYDIEIDETTFDTATDGAGSGSVVGYLVDGSGTSSGVTYSYEVDGDENPTLSFSSETQRSFSAAFYVVTAYDADSYDGTSLLENDVEADITPVDGKDEPDPGEASASTAWGEYKWKYDGDSDLGVGIKKYASSTSGNYTTLTSSRTYNAYETLYEINQAKGSDTGAFTYYTRSTGHGYPLTHDIEEGSPTLGEWNGDYYTVTTVDDALYLYPTGGTTPARMLGKDDYYFSSVRVTITDYGYDIWEDRTTTPEAPEGVNQDVDIYAMFYEQGADADADGWEKVDTVPFSSFTSSGTMSYTFSNNDLARQPYRVKVVHNTVNYETECAISVGLTLRYDSPMIKWCMDEYGDSLDNLRIENLSGIAGQKSDGTYFQDQSTAEENYSEKDTYTGETLLDFTEGLYGTVLARDNAYANLTSLDETAACYKGVTTESDEANSRVLENYYLTAYEAYYVTGEDTVSALKGAGISLPDRNDVAYYDLLPYGVQFNASAPVTAGRITAMNSTGSWQTNAGAWDQTGVTVTVNDEDVITNWNNTGRTMVIFHIHYDGDDASAFYDVKNSDNDLWYQGYGISFQAYYDWTDMSIVDAEYNIAAYVAENVTDESQQLLGKHNSDVWKDDGSVNAGIQYDPFKISDLNGDGITDLYTNMYASASTTTNVATASVDGVKKTVRADEDIVAGYESTALVGEGNGYTYEVAVTNGSGALLSDIVLFDRLEYAVEDGRYDMEKDNPDSVFYGLTADEIANRWTGTFNGLTLSSLEDLGIDPVVYYNEDRNATISENEENGDAKTTPTDVLTEANGWYKDSEYEESHAGDLSKVKAIAVDISTMTDGSPFELEMGESLSFQIHMIAPEDVGEDALYAFNNPAYYSVSEDSFGGTSTATTSEGNATRVEIGEAGTLEVEKEFTEGAEVPASMTNASYTFVLKRGDSYLPSQEYMVYEWDGSDWVSTDVIRSTDFNGQFTLKAGQKAVFSDVVDVDELTVAELESAFWENTTADRTEEENDVSYLFKNSYRSPVYFYKTALTTDLATEEELADAQFTFLIETDPDGDGEYAPLANAEVLYVSEALTDGSSPLVLDRTTTDANGQVTVGIGDIIAFFPEDTEGNKTVGVSYRITEVATGDSWICENDTVTGTTSDYGSAATISNYYKYRALVVTKDLLDYDYYDIDDCTSTWTFRLTDANGDPVAGNAWYMIDASGNLVCDDSGEPIEGELDESGYFTFSGAGSNRRIVIVGLVEGENYTLTETELDTELYEKVNDGAVDVTMPTYSTTKDVSITNKYLLRNLEVQKIALTEKDNTRVNSYVFTFVLTDGNGEAVADARYTIKGGDGTVYYTDEQGQFTVCGNHTVIFDSLGYEFDEFTVTEVPDEAFPQVYPADGAPNTASLGSGGASVQFINGDFDSFATITKELEGLDEVGVRYKAIEDEDGWQQTLKFTGFTSYPAMGYYASEMGFEIDNPLGTCVTDDAGDIDDVGVYDYILIYIEADGSYEIDSYNGGWVNLGIMPNDHYYIADLNEGDTIVVDESAKETNIVYPINNNFVDEVGADYIISSGLVMHGEEGAGGTITLVNGIASAQSTSSVYKLMTEGSSEVPVGAQITFRVERYSAETGTWSPASGINYITMDGYTGNRSVAADPTGTLETTGSDGKITLTKTENGYPYIRFTEDEVYVNVYEGMADGQLRIVEVASDTDEEWGVVAGYDGEGWENTPALNVVYGDTIYDTNETMRFEVEKVAVDADEGDEFTYTLEHVLSAEKVPITTHSDVIESELGRDVYYEVYDTETGKYISDGYTDANGQFTLKAGQYAVFYVEADSSWCIFESIHTGYVLDDVTANSDKADNAFVVDEKVGVVMNGEESVEADRTKVFAIYSADDNSLTFYTDDELPQAGSTYNGKTATIVYTGFDTTEYTRFTRVPWYNLSSIIESVTFDESYASAQPISMAYWFFNFTNCTSWDLANTDVSKVTSLYDTFYHCTGLTSLESLAEWDVSSVTSLYCTFEYCAYLESLEGLENWNVSSVTAMDGTFRYCESVSSFEALAEWDVSRVTSLYATFEGCGITSLEGLADWKVGNVTSLEATFRYCYELTDMEALADWNVSNVQSLAYTFEGCQALSDISALSGWNTSSVTSMYGTFRYCYALADLTPISNWVTSNVTTMYGMFDGDSEITTLDPISGWDVSNVTTLCTTFQDCSSLTDVEALAEWDTGSVTNMYSTFAGCSGLTDGYGLTDWDTSAVTTMERMFFACSAMTEIDVSKWNAANVSNMQQMFRDCSSLVTIYSDDSVFVTSGITDSSNGSNMFINCGKLVGGNGTTYSGSNSSFTMAHVDTANAPGYFTATPWDHLSTFAVYSEDDNSLTFYHTEEDLSLNQGDTYNEKTVTNVYTGIENLNCASSDGAPWYVYRSSNIKVVFDSSFADAQPVSLAYWFYGFANASFTGLEYIDTSAVTSLEYTFYNCTGLTDVDGLSGWKTSAVTTLAYTFYGCTGLTDVAGLANWDTSAVTTLAYTFYGCTGLTDVAGLANWNTGVMTTMAYMFYGCSALANLDGLSGWDTSAVTTLEHTFYGCTGLTDVDSLSGWKTSAVTTLADTFYGCSALANLNGLSGWDTSAVTTLEYTFYGCTGLTDVDVGLSGWDTSAVTTLEYTFYNCSGLTDVAGLSGWDTSAVTTLEYTFYGCTGLANVVGLSGWDTSAVTTLEYTFYDCSGLTNLGGLTDEDGLNGWDTSNVTTMAYTFYGCSGLTDEDGIGDWNTSNVTNMDNAFSNCSALEDFDLSGWDTTAVTSASGFATGCPDLQHIVLGEKTNIFTMGQLVDQQFWFYSTESRELASRNYLRDAAYPGEYWGYTNDKIMAFAVYSADDNSLSFYYGEAPAEGDIYKEKTATAVYEYVDYLSSTGTSDIPWYSLRTSFTDVVIDESFAEAQPISLAYWFYGFTNATGFTGLANINTSAVTTLYYTFYNCSKLTDVDGLAAWDTSAVTTLYGTFYGCSGLTDVDDLAKWDTSAVTTLFYTFRGCSGLTDVDGLAKWDTSAVTTLYGTFYGCSGLTDADNLVAWNTSAVTTLAYTFYNCSKLTDVEGPAAWNTSAVTTLAYTFYGCSGLTDVDGLAAWDTSKVTTLTYTFYGCSGLTDVADLSGWDTSAVTTLSYTFRGCTGLTDVGGIADWDTSKVTTLSYMFYGCTGLTKMDVSKWNTAKVTNMSYMFNGCSNLATIYSDDEVFVTNAVTSGGNMFTNCSKLVGGSGTAYSSSDVTYTMAHIDKEGNPGYFTDVADKP